MDGLHKIGPHVCDPILRDLSLMSAGAFGKAVSASLLHATRKSSTRVLIGNDDGRFSQI